MNDWILWASVGALVAVIVVLWVLVAREDYRKARGRDADVWVRQDDAAHDAYNEWLIRQDIATWPYEPPAGFDERKESA